MNLYTAATTPQRAAFRFPRYILLLLAALLLHLPQAGATHLVGGSVSYRFVKQINGKNRYEITFSIYRDCLNGLAEFDETIEVGFYENTGGAPPLIVPTIKIPLYRKRKVNPPSGGSKCEGTPNVCLEEGIYIDYVDLDPSSYGYHFMYSRCCRNKMVNVPEEEGQTYYGFISPDKNAKPNTSPYFTDVPAPYICERDTVSLVYTATEPDGDSLVYKLAHPWAGGTKDDPKPTPEDFFPGLPPIRFNNGYTYLKPLGNSGVATIDPITGLLKLYATIKGFYAIAVDVYEYRDGKLLQITRRDIQIIVTGCKPNTVPQRQPVNGNLSSTYFITAGDSLSFGLKYSDPTDSLTLTTSGDIFDNTKTNPAATLPAAKGLKDVNSWFRWQTSCSQGRSQPYIFTIKVMDNGCPAKVVNHTITVFVAPFKGADKINGPSPACAGTPGNIYYTKPSSTQGKIIWKVTGGQVVKTSTRGDSITVVWNTVPNGVIKMVEVGNGCIGDTIEKIIKIHPKPAKPVISGKTNPCIGKVTDYSVTQQTGMTYTWIVEKGVIESGKNTSKITVRWTQTDSARIYLIQTDVNGCSADTAVLSVVIGSPRISEIYGNVSVCPNSEGIDYWVDSQPGSTYSWIVTGGVQSAGGNGPQIQVNWGNKGAGMVKVVEITQDGCVSDTLELPVTVDYVLRTPGIKGDTSLCEFTRGVVYEVPRSNGSSYEWKIVGGTIVSGLGTHRIVVDWDKATTAFLTVKETAYDPVNNKPCIGIPVDLLVYVHPNPQTSDIQGPVEICENDAAVYRVKGFPGSKYVWLVNGKVVANNADSLVHLFQLAPGDKDTLHLHVTEITKDSCVGVTQFLAVRIHRLPTTSDIGGPGIVCYPNLDGIVYEVTGQSTSTYEWEIDGGAVMSGAGTPRVVVNWFVAGNREVRVKEVNDFGCAGPVKTLPVKVDSLSLTLDYVTTARPDDKVIELYWTKKNDQFFNGYFRIYRKSDGEEVFKLIDTVPASQTYYVDRRVETDRMAYRYKIEAQNSCGTTVATNVHRTILLKGSTVNDSSVRIDWNPYEGWDGGVDYYNVHRSSNDDTTLLFHDMTKDLTMSMITSLEGWKICYRIAARPAQGMDYTSWSNKYCFDLEPRLWIPNAFTPSNYDRLNNTFRVVASNYKSFKLTIFNRWGERIFTSDSAENQWDGTFRGTDCPEGVYLYLIEVKGGKTSIYRNGTLHLMR